MSFTSIGYAAFLVVAWLLVAHLGRPKTTLYALLAASYLFYATWSPWFWLVLLASSLGNFGLGLWLRRNAHPAVLWTGLAFNILLLATFKYFRLTPAFLGAHGSVNFGEPIGLSFYSFQAMSYLFDTYRRADNTHASWPEFLLYLAFWPTVLAGPVCRIGEMLPQFRRLGSSTREDITAGALRIGLGLLMKLLVADTLKIGIGAGAGVDAGFEMRPGHWSGLDVWFLAVAFGFQLYCDFAGYSHIAIGSARLFGVRVRENFNAPYTSRTPAEFWTRWHMSLSFWIRDYLFFPLATLRRSTWWRHMALVVSMAAFGLWHGATAPFVLWGLYHGGLLVGHRLIQQVQRAPTVHPVKQGRTPLTTRSLATFASCSATFLLVNLGWTLFRATDLAQATAMLRAVVSPGAYLLPPIMRTSFYLLVIGVAGGYFASVVLASHLARLVASPHGTEALAPSEL